MKRKIEAFSGASAPLSREARGPRAARPAQRGRKADRSWVPSPHKTPRHHAAAAATIRTAGSARLALLTSFAAGAGRLALYSVGLELAVDGRSPPVVVYVRLYVCEHV